MASELTGLPVPAVPTGDYELDTLISAFRAGTLDGEGRGLLTGELAERSGMAPVPNHRNDLGDGCPYGSEGEPYYTGDGTCPVYCHEADVLVGFDAGDRELPDSTDLPAELYEREDGVNYAVHPDVYP